ncbi:hypothetical protein NQ317_001914 [Molorchus minor]|uniref:Uncharacterized protein n=1 Tax=Molorchus minor TaxID=1323400 RepID=A0ABQ9JE70_9CUCU|nr:hypothetical protein NQ317_001914 [Molorchus minor]
MMELLMTKNGDTLCRLCLQVHHNDFETINHTTTAIILNILNLNMNLAISMKPVICKKCVDDVKMAFDFKSTCLFTEELVISFAWDQQTFHFELKDIYKEHKSLVTANDSVCRFCLTCSETSNFLSLDIMKEEGLVSQEMLDFYLPEIDYNIVELLVCRSCVRSLVNYLKFVTVCATTEETIIKYCGQIDINDQDPVELNGMFRNENESEIKLNIETNYRPTKNNDNEVFDVNSVPGIDQQKKLVREENSEVEMYECENVEKSEVEIYECETCHFKTKYKRSLHEHLLVHKENSWRCINAKCVITRQNINSMLTSIFLVHRENSEVNIQSIKLDSYNIVLLHRKNSEVEMYECETCHFKTKYNSSLRKHLLIHRENSEVEMYECKTCTYKTKLKGNLNRHLLIHREKSEVEIYECETCHFKTKYKRSLHEHLLVHKEKF